MAEESEPVQDLVMGLSRALEAYKREPALMQQPTNPRDLQLLDEAERLTEAFRAAAQKKRDNCPQKPPG